MLVIVVKEIFVQEINPPYVDIMNSFSHTFFLLVVVVKEFFVRHKLTFRRHEYNMNKELTGHEFNRNLFVQVLDAMFEKRAEPGEYVIRQGDDGDNFYVIENGVFDVLVTGDDRVEKVSSLFSS